MSQLSLGFRYVYDKDKSIREDFIEVVSAFDELGRFVAEEVTKTPTDSAATPRGLDDEGLPETDEETTGEESPQELSLTGEAVGKIVLNRLKTQYFLDVKKCVGAGTDSCSVMTSDLRGAVTETQKEAENVLKTSCYNHKLNNALSKSNNVPEVKKAMSTMNELVTFFSYTKRRHVLKKILRFSLKTICETRWVERRDGVLQFEADLPGIIQGLSEVALWKNAQTANKAHCLILALCEPRFIIAVCSLSSVLSYTKQLSQALQSEDLDLSQGTDLVTSAINVLTRRREEAEQNFHLIWKNALDLAKKIDMEPPIERTVPRQCKKQLYRSNLPTSKPEDFYRQSIYIPILDNVVSDLRSRFPPESLAVFSLPALLPEKIVKSSAENEAELSETLWKSNHRILPIEASIGQRSLASEGTFSSDLYFD